MHNYRTFQNMVIFRYATRAKVPYVLHAHGSLPRIVARHRLKRAYDQLWGHSILRDASKLIATGSIEAEQYRGAGIEPDRFEVIPNGISLSEFEQLPERGEFRRKRGVDRTQTLILYLGRIHEIKGLALLARAFASIARHAPDARLAIVGPDGGYLPKLRRLVGELDIREKVIFTGPLYGRDRLEAYVDADTYVLPSYYEIFGITVLEALACSTPVVLTDRCGIADAVDNRAALVVPYDEGRLTEALRRMLGDDSMVKEFRRKGRALVQQEFNWERIAERVERVYEQVSKNG